MSLIDASMFTASNTSEGCCDAEALVTTIRRLDKEKPAAVDG